MSFIRSRHRSKQNEIKIDEKTVMENFYQNAAVIVSYHDTNGDLFFLLGQNPRFAQPNQKKEYIPFGFPGGKVETTDETEAVKLYKKNKKEKLAQKQTLITSVNRAAAVRELKEATGIDIEKFNQLHDLNLVSLRQHRITTPPSIKRPKASEVSFYHVHLGRVGKEMQIALNAILDVHMANGREGDLFNVQFVNFKDIAPAFIVTSNKKIMKAIMEFIQRPVDAEPLRLTLTAAESFREALKGHILFKTYEASSENIFTRFLSKKHLASISAAQKLFDVLTNKTTDVVFSRREMAAFAKDRLGRIVRKYKNQIPEDVRKLILKDDIAPAATANAVQQRIMPVVSEPLSQSEGGVSRQAEEFWDDYIQPRLDNDKKVAVLYAANARQARLLISAFPYIVKGDQLKAVFVPGSGQARLFYHLVQHIEDDKAAANVRVLPIATSLHGGANSPGNHVSIKGINEHLTKIAWHLGNGWDVIGIGNSSGFSIGGKASKYWYKTDPIAVHQDNAGKYSLQVREGLKPAHKILLGGLIGIAALTAILVLLSVIFPPVSAVVGGGLAYGIGLTGLQVTANTLTAALGSALLGLFAAIGFSGTTGIGMLIHGKLKTKPNTIGLPRVISQGQYLQEHLSMLSQQPTRAWPHFLQTAYYEGLQAKQPLPAVKPVAEEVVQPAVRKRAASLGSVSKVTVFKSKQAITKDDADIGLSSQNRLDK